MWALVDVERLAPGLRVRAHDRDARRVTPTSAAGAAVADRGPPRLRHVGEGRAVDRGQAVEHPLQAGRERVVGRVHVREHRVAAVRRNLAGDQHRGHRRALEVHGVAVPDAAEVRPSRAAAW